MLAFFFTSTRGTIYIFVVILAIFARRRSTLTNVGMSGFSFYAVDRRADRWRSPLSRLFIFFGRDFGSLREKFTRPPARREEREGGSARDIRLVVMNGHGAVVRNPGELNDAQGAQTDGTAG